MSKYTIFAEKRRKNRHFFRKKGHNFFPRNRRLILITGFEREGAKLSLLAYLIFFQRRLDQKLLRRKLCLNFGLSGRKGLSILHYNWFSLFDSDRNRHFASS